MGRRAGGLGGVERELPRDVVGQGRELLVGLVFEWLACHWCLALSRAPAASRRGGPGLVGRALVVLVMEDCGVGDQDVGAVLAGQLEVDFALELMQVEATAVAPLARYLGSARRTGRGRWRGRG